MRRLAVAVVIVATMATSMSEPAAAGDNSSGDTITVTSGEAGVDLVVPGRPGEGGGGPGNGGGVPPVPGKPPLLGMCPLLQFLSIEPRACDEGDAAAVADPGLALALRLRAELTITMAGIRTAPPVGRASIVGVATWLWVEPVGGQVLSVTATEGPLSVTVTARPGGVDWDTGDGHRLHCAGIGSPFVPGRSDPGQRPACGHTYAYRSTRSDPAGTYLLRASMTYQVGWSANTGQGGALAPATVTAAVPITVHELQAVLD